GRAGAGARGGGARGGPTRSPGARGREGGVGPPPPPPAAPPRHVGNPRVRNRGTFGGSLAHADPAAELPVVALAHGGEIVAHGPGGARRIPLGEFFLGYLETALAPDEVLVAAELARLQDGSGV